MSIVTVYIPSPYNVFLYFLEGQVHKDNKLGIMTNVGKSRLVKVILTNIHKISDACANSFGGYIMIAQPSALQQLFSPHLFNFIQKFLDPPPFKKEGRVYAFFIRDYKGETTKLLPFYMTDFYLQNCKVITFEEN